MASPTSTIIELPNINFAKPRNQTALRLAVSQGKESWELTVPVFTWGGGEGPGTLIVSGQHGSEYQGILGLNRIIRDHGDQLRGNLIIVPALNPSALAIGSRTSPLDGLDLNRSFPGKAEGSPSQQLAYAVSTSLLPHAGVVLDLHSGGQNISITPSVWMHRLGNVDQFERMLSASQGFDIPSRVLIDESHKSGMLDTLVEDQGKLFYCAEMGGGALDQGMVNLTTRLIRSFLTHFGHLDFAPASKRPARLMESPTQAYRLTSPIAGIFSPFVKLGQKVSAGTELGEIVDMVRTTDAPLSVRAPVDGVVFMFRVNGKIDVGQEAVVLARPVSAKSIAPGLRK